MFDLTPFLSNDEDARWFVRQPIVRNGFVYYTDGTIMARVPAPPDADNTEDAPEVDRPLLSVLEKTCDAVLPEIALPDKDPEAKPDTCKTCDGLGYLLTCTECSGKGESACCECGNERECENCEGEGALIVSRSTDGTPNYQSDDERCHECDECEGAGEYLFYSTPPIIACEIAPGLWVSSLIYRRLRALPNLRLSTDGTFGPFLFKFDGGEGCFMPITTPTGNLIPDGRRIAAYIPLTQRTEAA